MPAIRVLLIEDDPDIGNLLQETLEPAFECLRASNGLEGLQLAEEGEPDLIVCDIMMPVMDGHEFILRLRKDPRFGSMPVIFLSALGSQDHIRKGYTLGASLYLSKPIDPSRFKRNVQLFIEDHGIAARTKSRTAEEVRAGAAPPAAAPPPPRPVKQTFQFERKRPAEEPGLSTSQRAAGEEPDDLSGTAIFRPVAPRPAPEPRRPAAPTPPPPPPERIKIRVLAVDDDEEFIRAVRLRMDKEFEIIPAGDGIAAIERAVRYKPDIFVVSGSIPKMTGYQLAGMLRKNRLFQNAPIVFLTPKESDRDRIFLEKLGVRYFLHKPVEPERLRDTIDLAAQEPGFDIRTERVPFEIAMEELALPADIETTVDEALRASHMMKLGKEKERKERRAERESWRD